MFCAQIIMGLEHIHSLGFLHDDLHLGNILVGNDGKLKIADYGLAEAGTAYSKNRDCINNK